MTILILLIVFIILNVSTSIALFVIKKKLDNKTENLSILINKINDYVRKLDIKIESNGDDIIKIRREKSAFRNELNNMQKIIETLNNGFAIPSYKNT